MRSVYFLPYKDTSDKIYTCFTRSSLCGNYHYTVWFGSDNVWRNTSTGEYFKTKEDAMTDVDYYIIEIGSKIIPDNEVDRFTKKLVILL